MTYLEMLTEAHEALVLRGIRVMERYAYFEGRHPSKLDTEAWAKTFALQVKGTIDNQIARGIHSTVKAVSPTGVQAVVEDTVDEALAIWATELLKRSRAAVLEALEHAEVSAEQTCILTDYSATGEVVMYALDPRSVYVATDRAGRKLWACWFWRATPNGVVSATLQTPEETVEFSTGSKEPLPSPGAFLMVDEPRPNSFGEVMLAVAKKPHSIIDRAIPAQDRLNKSLQTQVAVGEQYAARFRAWFGLPPRIDPKTGKLQLIGAQINPATGTRDATFPAVDAEGNELRVEQLEAPTPGAYLEEQDSDRAVIAGHFSVPAFTLQVKGVQPVSAEALEIAYRDYIDNSEDLRDLYGDPFLGDAIRLAVRRYLYAVTGSASEAPRLEVLFAPISTTTLGSRTQALVSLVAAGMTLEDALVETWGMSREAAEAIAQAGEDAKQRASERAADAFERGFAAEV